MSGDIDIRQALRAFHIISTHGVQNNQGQRLDGLTASTDFDGYTATIANDFVTLDMLFHNKYNFNYSNRIEKDKFLEKLARLDSDKAYAEAS